MNHTIKQSGVDISVIALWLAMKERALTRLHEPAAKIQRYTAPDSLLAFLRKL